MVPIGGCLVSSKRISEATWHDKITPKLLKDSADIIAPSFATIFNQFILTGILPDDLKVAIISPVHKSGDKANYINYRPISVLSTMSKVFEKLISKQLFKKLETNNIRSSHRTGFRKNQLKQSFLLLISITNKWLINKDQGYLNGVIFLDLTKAFDSIDHNILLIKMKLCGLTDHSLKWFRSYLKNRRQLCKIQHVQSKSRPA